MKKIRLLLTVCCVLALVGCGKQMANSNHQEIVSAKKKIHKRRRVKMTNIKVVIGGKTLKAQLNSTAAAKDFKKDLPKTLTFTSFMSNPEKMADLHHALSLKGMPKGDEGKAGEIGYWSPDRRIIFYYGHVDYYPGIHIIGKFTTKDYHKVVSKLKDNTKVKIELAK